MISIRFRSDRMNAYSRSRSNASVAMVDAPAISGAFALGVGAVFSTDVALRVVADVDRVARYAPRFFCDVRLPEFVRAMVDLPTTSSPNGRIRLAHATRFGYPKCGFMPKGSITTVHSRVTMGILCPTIC